MAEESTNKVPVKNPLAFKQHLQSILEHLQWSEGDLSTVSEKTLSRIYSNETKGVQIGTARDLADALERRAVAIGKKNRYPWTQFKDCLLAETGVGMRVREWTIVEQFEWETAPNGLRYRTARMSSSQGETCRNDHGKCYDLDSIQLDDRTQVAHYFRRHGEVALRLERKSDHIPHHRTAFSDGPYQWVIDEWVDGQTLEWHLTREPLPNKVIPHLFEQLAMALNALHEDNIIMRDLSPKHILISASDSHLFLTHLEMAKVLSAKQSVGPKDWKNQPYRAPEVTSQTRLPSVASDIYSWAAILIHTVTNTIPEQQWDWGAMVASAQLPPRLEKFVLSCLHLDPGSRPQKMAQALQAMKRWSI